MQKRYNISITTGLALIITGILAGCGPTGSAKPPSSNVPANNVTGFKSGYNATSTNVTSSKSQIRKRADFSNMSPSQLANYDQMHGVIIPFSGTHVKRVLKNQAQSIIPNGYLMKPDKTKFINVDYAIVDAWTGDLHDKPFYLTIYSNKQTGDIVIGIKYDNQVKTASLIKSQKYVIKNFTGRFVIFGVPYIEGPFYGYDLTTGNVVKPGKIVDQMSGDFPVQGAGGPLWIQGLDKKYPFKQ